MRFEDIPSGSSVFLDANVFDYDFGPDPVFGIPSQKLLERIEFGELQGLCSTHELSNVAHRLWRAVSSHSTPRLAAIRREWK